MWLGVLAASLPHMWPQQEFDGPDVDVVLRYRLAAGDALKPQSMTLCALCRPASKHVGRNRAEERYHQHVAGHSCSLPVAAGHQGLLA